MRSIALFTEMNLVLALDSKKSVFLLIYEHVFVFSYEYLCMCIGFIHVYAFQLFVCKRVRNALSLRKCELLI